MNHLRDYQIETADSIEREWGANDATLAVLATGLGKTVIFAEIIRRRRAIGRTLVLAHREELIFQARKKIEHFTGIECEIEMADQVASTSMFHQMPVVIATIQTLVSGRKAKRMERFSPQDFATLIFDEAHHGCADTWKSVLDYFKSNPDLKILGVTATPDRTDEAALGQIFQSTAANIGILEGIDMGWLVPVEQQMVTVEGLDFSSVRTTAGDLNGADLAAIMEAEKNLHGLCSSTIEIVGNRQTIVFTASVKHAEMACNIFNRHRTGIAEWICGTTPKERRRKIMDNMHSAKTQILCNVGVATEGFDCHAVEVIVMGRPTKSRSLFAQMAGRATRPLPGVVDGLDDTAPEVRRTAIAGSAKKSCLLVDMVGNSGRHKLVTALDLLGGTYPEDVRALAHELIEEDGGNRNTMDALNEAKEKLAQKRAKELEEKERAEEARKARVKAKAKFSTRYIDPFDVCDIAPDLSKDSATGVLTARDKEKLTWAKVNWEDMNYAQQMAVIRESDRRYKAKLCSIPQMNTLKKHGFDGSEMTKVDASRLIDQIAANGWRRPANPCVNITPQAQEMQPAGVYSQEDFL